MSRGLSKGPRALVTRINEEHAKCEVAARNALEHAFTVGELLADAKAQVPHGQWASWVKTNCDFSLRTAQGYMRIAARADELGGKTQRVAHLPIRRALALLSSPLNSREPLEAAKDALHRIREIINSGDPEMLSANALETNEVADEFLKTTNEHLDRLRNGCDSNDLTIVRATITEAAEWQQLCGEFTLRMGRAAGILLASLQRAAP